MDNLGDFADTRTLRLERRLPAPPAEVWRQLYGGVVAAAVDALGAFHAGMAGQRRLAREGDKSDRRTLHLRTIGLNLDYLKPLAGDAFTATTSVLDVGAHVIRMRGEVVSDQGATVAAGTISYAY